MPKESLQRAVYLQLLNDLFVVLRSFLPLQVLSRHDVLYARLHLLLYFLLMVFDF